MGTQALPSMAPPESYEDLQRLIAERYASLSGQMQKIAQFSLDNPNEVSLETVSELANRIGVQPSSMVRFAKTFGYSGFSALQQIYRGNLMANTLSYPDRIRSIRDDDPNDGDSVLMEFVGEGIASLEHLGASISSESLQEATRILADSEEIYIVAQGRSFPVAFYMSYALARLERRNRLLDGVGGTLRQQADMATLRDAFIAISFHPYSTQVTEIVTDRNEAGVPIISITDSAISPLTLEATVAFQIKEREHRVFRSLIAPMCLAQSLVVSLGHLLAARINGKPA